MKNLWLSWSTGKDSAYSLHKLKQRSDLKITGLFTTVTDDYDRVAMHATRVVLLKQQAQVLELPLHLVTIPKNCSNETYQQQMQKLIKQAQNANVQAMGFGDLYLEDIRTYRELLLKDSGIETEFPLWKIPTPQLAQDMIQIGIEAVLTCVDPRKLPSSFVGRSFDRDFLNDLPPNVDPCGENGEFHTFVHASPDFRIPIPYMLGESIERDGFVFQDVLPRR